MERQVLEQWLCDLFQRFLPFPCTPPPFIMLVGVTNLFCEVFVHLSVRCAFESAPMWFEIFQPSTFYFRVICV